MKEFEIFRTGKHTSDKGITKEYTEEDLDKIVSNYNSDDPAPIVIGHPKTNDPAYGWIDKIKRVKDKLIAFPKQLNDEFVKLIKAGSFKKRSISITPDLKLNHIGFLGAAAPAVSGLKEIEFSTELELLSFSVDLPPESIEVKEDSETQVPPSKTSKENNNMLNKDFTNQTLQNLTSIVSELQEKVNNK